MLGEELHGGRILVVHQGAIGDLILALPAIKALRDALQPEWLEIMGHPWILPLVAGLPYADATSDVNRAEMAPFFLEGALLPEVRRRYCDGFDAAFCFGQSTTLARNLHRAGIEQTVTLPSFPDRRIHLIDHHRSSLNALGIPCSPAPPKLFLYDDERQWAEEFLHRRGLIADEIIALHPGAGSRKKAWPPQRFAALGRTLAHKTKKLLIIEGPADKEAVAEVIAGLNGIPYLLVHDTPLKKLAALVSYASLFVGNDSGISHLSAALGVTTLAIFGPTDASCWAPRGEHTFWLQGTAECSPCGLKRYQSCQRQRCLESIKVEDVLTVLNENMNSYHNTRSPQENTIDIKQLSCSHTKDLEEMNLPNH
ncbi:MAG: glycosyltransferase family 9 protein [Deltaproteobacteria bacterium]|nr:glycosyltransferase family 9 protein [Deltaproteobacteria bacterium]